MAIALLRIKDKAKEEVWVCKKGNLSPPVYTECRRREGL